GFNFDAGSTGNWKIVAWCPTGDHETVGASGTWTPADSEGWWRAPSPTGEITLENGHYKLYAKQTSPMTEGGYKQKVFWVECEHGTTGTSSSSTSSTGGSTSTNTTGSTSTSTTGSTSTSTTGSTSTNTTGSTSTNTTGSTSTSTSTTTGATT